MKEVEKLFWKHKSCATCIAEGSTEWCQGVACPEWKPKKSCTNCNNYLGNGICTGNSKNEMVDYTGEHKCWEPKEEE